MPYTPIAEPSELIIAASTSSLGIPLSSSTQTVTKPLVSITNSVVVENPTSTLPQEVASGDCKVKLAAHERTHLMQTNLY